MINTCKNCLHYEACNPNIKITAEMFRNVTDAEPCKHFTDRSEWAHLPCAEGTRFYKVENNTNACYDCSRYDFYNEWCECKNIDWPFAAKLPVCNKHHLEVVTGDADKDFILHHINDFGKTVFFTREEAEKALERMKEKIKR